MTIINSIITWVMQKRIHQIELFMKYPHEVQFDIFQRLIETAADTEFGRKYHFKEIKTAREFRERVPLHHYEDLFPFIDRMMKGEKNILWPTEIKWFSKSSGTTNARSKFIPVSKEALDECHFKGGKDLYSFYSNNYPDTHIFSGKGLAIGGTHQANEFDLNENSHYGDVSAVIMANLPFYAQLYRTPSLDIALMDEWEDKIEQMAQSTIQDDVTHFLGVPTWTLVLLQRVLEITGKSHIKEVWPNLEAFVHGAVAFEPYESSFNALIPKEGMHYMETYNASEGFFGIQDQKDSKDLLLMLDYGIYYEFIPMEEWDNEEPKTITLEDVELGKNYAMVISTNAGLWRYLIGDTVRFTSISPYRVRISGRTKHFINAFGEEVIVENADQAITAACEATGAIMSNYTAAPIFLEVGVKGGHEWIVEFEKDPDDAQRFTEVLDQTLRQINSDYDAKRYKNIALEIPKVHVAPAGTFYKWMKNRGKLGGQHKVPRLSNKREYVEEILKLL
ncbi:GH3 auxin-responsive promoter family protein [Persicobacter sp. CCB-QB2]|uniref:GH3 auxin-responsive promoter family protein n=1 Tax=Persicobacter sp. CCB-QB2 TaxID=1561025 RepID=UPI0006A9E6F7|nr:GH3 auxin-responsive promoter family protein [Persicobacter sp. CCB-QB2]